MTKFIFISNYLVIILFISLSSIAHSNTNKAACLVQLNESAQNRSHFSISLKDKKLKQPYDSTKVRVSSKYNGKLLKEALEKIFPKEKISKTKNNFTFEIKGINLSGIRRILALECNGYKKIEGKPPIFVIERTSFIIAKDPSMDMSIKKELEVCNRHIENKNLTTHSGGKETAFNCFSRLLEKAPSEAKKGLDKIATIYINWAEKSINEKKLDNANHFFNKAQQIKPISKKIELQINALFTKLENPSAQNSSPNQITNSTNQTHSPPIEPNTTQTSQNMVPLSPEKLNLCYKHIKNRNLTTNSIGKEPGTAFECFSNLLDKFPLEAQKGLNEIINKYLDWTMQSITKKNLINAYHYLEQTKKIEQKIPHTSNQVEQRKKILFNEIEKLRTELGRN